MANNKAEKIKIIYEIDDNKFKKKINENNKLIKRSSQLIQKMWKKIDTNWINKLKKSLTWIKSKAKQTENSVKKIWSVVKVTWISKLRNKLKKTTYLAKDATSKIKKMWNNVNTKGVDWLISKLNIAKWLALAAAWWAWIAVFNAWLNREEFVKESYVQRWQKDWKKLINFVDAIKKNSSLTDYSEIANAITKAVSLWIKDIDVLTWLAISSKVTDTSTIARGMNSIQNTWKWTSQEKSFETIRYLEQITWDPTWDIAENFAEYAPYFKEAGYNLMDAAKMFAIWVEKGIYQTDKIWDVVKEQQLAFTDKSTKDDFQSFNKIWLSWEQLFKDLNSWKTNIKKLNKLFFKKLEEKKSKQNRRNCIFNGYI